jgi:hypothetical protein
MTSRRCANDRDDQGRCVVSRDDKEDPACQEIAMRNRVPIVISSIRAGVNLPYQGGVFPGNTARAHLSITTRSCGIT